MLHELGRGLMKTKLYICEYEYKKESFKADEKKVRDFVLNFALRDNGAEDAKIIKGEHGKPYLEGNPFFLSISHCKGLVISAVSDEEIGADCELIRPHDLRILERVADENEKSRIIDSDSQMNEFFRLWTMKEAYVKMLGVGIGCDLKSIDTSGEKIKVGKERAYRPFYFVYKDKFAVCVVKNKNVTEKPDIVILEDKLDRKT